MKRVEINELEDSTEILVRPLKLRWMFLALSVLLVVVLFRDFSGMGESLDGVSYVIFACCLGVLSALSSTRRIVFNQMGVKISVAGLKDSTRAYNRTLIEGFELSRGHGGSYARGGAGAMRLSSGKLIIIAPSDIGQSSVESNQAIVDRLNEYYGFSVKA